MPSLYAKKSQRKTRFVKPSTPKTKYSKKNSQSLAVPEYRKDYSYSGSVKTPYGEDVPRYVHSPTNGEDYEYKSSSKTFEGFAAKGVLTGTGAQIALDEDRYRGFRTKRDHIVLYERTYTT